MIHQRNRLLHLVLCFGCLAFLWMETACRKGEKDPWISFIPRKERVVGKWEVTRFKEDGSNILDNNKMYYYFNRDGSMAIESKPEGGLAAVYHGKWNFTSTNNNSKKRGSIVFVLDDGWSEFYEMIELSNKKMELEAKVNSIKIEIKMEKD